MADELRDRFEEKRRISEKARRARERQISLEMRGMYAEDMDRIEDFIREKFPAEAASMDDVAVTVLELLDRLYRWSN